MLRILESNQKFLKISNISSIMLMSLTEDILDLAKMEAGIFTLAEDYFPIKTVVREIEYIFELQ